MIAADAVQRARSVSLETEIGRRGIKLRRQGAELVGPCPRCGGTDRFAINTRKQCFNCRGCGARGDLIALVQHLDGCGFAAAITTLTGDLPRPQAVPSSSPPAETPDEYERKQHKKAAWLWSQRRPLKGTIAEHYLRDVRGLASVVLPLTLGFLPAHGEHPPALISAFALAPEPVPGALTDPHDVRAVHLTALKPDGSGKADVDPNKKMIASPAGLPIVLAPVSDALALAITEGIEDALTVYMATGLGAWAAGSAGFMPKLAKVVPNYTEAVTIYAHADEAGQDGARRLAAALRDSGIEITIEGLP